MTREERLDWLCRLRGQLIYFNMPDNWRTNFTHALSDEINDLQQEPCDCISRKYILSKAHCCCDDLADDEPCCVDVDDIKNAPSVQHMRTKGEWLAQQEANGDDYFKAWDIAGVLTYAARYKCNKCGFIQTCIEDHGQYSFCPNCGADMRESEE